jgi:hypothetical protein
MTVVSSGTYIVRRRASLCRCLSLSSVGIADSSSDSAASRSARITGAGLRASRTERTDCLRVATASPMLFGFTERPSSSVIVLGSVRSCCNPAPMLNGPAISPVALALLSSGRERSKRLSPCAWSSRSGTFRAVPREEGAPVSWCRYNVVRRGGCRTA